MRIVPDLMRGFLERRLISAAVAAHWIRFVGLHDGQRLWLVTRVLISWARAIMLCSPVATLGAARRGDIVIGSWRRERVLRLNSRQALK